MLDINNEPKSTHHRHVWSYKCEGERCVTTQREQDTEQNPIDVFTAPIEAETEERGSTGRDNVH